MTTATITYRYLVPDEGPATATWTGDRNDALQAAILALGAVGGRPSVWECACSSNDHAGRCAMANSATVYAYHPEELRKELAGEPLVVSADAMVELGAGICAGHELGALYDPWCASTAAAPSRRRLSDLDMLGRFARSHGSPSTIGDMIASDPAKVEELLLAVVRVFADGMLL
ncbi:MAG: hypothetical protein ACYTAN_17405 [Planctomycetota bacterium]